jgi:hypothetical protein
MKLKTYHLTAVITLVGALFLSPVVIFQAGSVTNFHAESKTCFYALHVPADIDQKPTQFDTVIVRSGTCQKHVIKLESWGTGTSYQILPLDSSKAREYSIFCVRGDPYYLCPID